MSDLEDAGEPELNAAAIAEVLNRHQVRYVIIGAFAAIAQQAPIPATRDIDLTPETGPENLARLSLALKELGARIRTEGVPGERGHGAGRAVLAPGSPIGSGPLFVHRCAGGDLGGADEPRDLLRVCQGNEGRGSHRGCGPGEFLPPVALP